MNIVCFYCRNSLQMPSPCGKPGSRIMKRNENSKMSIPEEDSSTHNKPDFGNHLQTPNTPNMSIRSTNSVRKKSTSRLTSQMKVDSRVVQSRSTESVAPRNEIKILSSQSNNASFATQPSSPFGSIKSRSKHAIHQCISGRESEQLPPLNFGISRKLAKFTKEKKAAKTLGTVMGIFIICWLPFFITNVISGICGQIGVECIVNPHIVMPVLTWLGWINSSMNPFIYACCSKDFRRYV